MLEWAKGPCGTVPKDAFKAGRDNNGNIVYVGKAVHYVTEYQSEGLPATVIASHTFAHASYGEKELDIDNYEVLCGYAFYWKPFIPHMPIPKGAVSTGKTVSDEDLFVVRVAHNKSDVIGKVHKYQKICYFPYNGEERQSEEFEILIEVPNKEKNENASAVNNI